MTDDIARMLAEEQKHNAEMRAINEQLVIATVRHQELAEAAHEAAEALRRQAHHDPLTGLPNRALLQDRLNQVLARAERSGEVAALLFLDLDHFKAVNDTWGHAAGDRLLQAVALRLTGCLRAEDTVARVGGDEFVVLLPNLQYAEDAAEVAQKVTAVLADPLMLEGCEMSVTASVGISLFPRDGLDAGTLTQKADAAMYQAKKGRSVGSTETEKRPS